jgi:Leucine-rich repeat (LRR) protein
MDINGDGYISVSEVSDVTTLNISGSPFDKKSRVKIENIKGIDGFKNLTVLSMSYNNVVNMDVSRNTKLTSLACDNIIY